MAKWIALDSTTLAWARHEFAEYYRRTPIAPPAQLARREFASFGFGVPAVMRRHATLAEPAEFRRFLSADEPPRHVYYSAAYYEAPDRPTMDAKGWLGADVIFDLDADHLRRAEGLSYAAQLAMVKAQFVKLLDEFLFGDFGIDPENVLLAFSGGRGYHAHVRDPQYQILTSAERRELVEYILGIGIDPTDALRRTRERAEASDPVGTAGGPAVATATGRRRSVTKPTRRLVEAEAPGWPGRIRRSFLEVLDEWSSLGAERTADAIARMGVSPAKSRGLARALVTGGKAELIHQRGSLDVFPRNVPGEIWKSILRSAIERGAGEVDVPVTTDVHRLIRLPGSLHGGTGMRVVPLTREDLDHFDPLRDAPIPDGMDRSIRVELATSIDCPFQQGRLRGAAGDSLDVAPSAALFLVLRGEATLAPGPLPGVGEPRPGPG